MFVHTIVDIIHEIVDAAKLHHVARRAFVLLKGEVMYTIVLASDYDSSRRGTEEEIKRLRQVMKTNKKPRWNTVWCS